MSWTLDKNVWKCSQYSDLEYDEILNLAEWGQPRNPYQPGYNYNFERQVDFANVVIEMPQREVMIHGYGRDVTARDFPIVRRFLWENLPFPYGPYTFNDLVRTGFARRADRVITAQLDLPFGARNDIGSGEIPRADAAFIHGTVGLALMAGTKFTYEERRRTVDAEIGALDDNWDFESSSVPSWLNIIVGTIAGPDHNNLEAPIRIRFRGPGKRSYVTEHR